MLHDALDAKEKLANAKVAEEVVAAIMALGPKKPELMSALVDCVCSNDTAKAIAHRSIRCRAFIDCRSTGIRASVSVCPNSQFSSRSYQENRPTI